MANKKSSENDESLNKETFSNDERIEIIEEKPRYWLTILKYGITFLVATGFVFVILWINNFWAGGFDKAQFYRKLSDAFSIPGLMFIFLALLLFVSQKGAFTGLGYALRHLARMLLPFIIKKDLTYAEYIENKEHRKAISMIVCFLLVGAVFLTVGIIFIFVFYKYY